MANIRTIHDFDAPARNTAPPRRSGYAMVNNSGQPSVAGVPDPGYATASMVAPENPAEQSLAKRLFPRMALYTFTTAITLFEVVMFIITLIVGGVKYDGAFVKGNEMGGPSSTTLYYMGGKCWPAIYQGNVWRLATPIVLHAGLLHILGNTFFQLRFGYVLEARWGIPRISSIYLLTGIGASLLSCLGSPDSISVGASGALFGLVGADITWLIYNWDSVPHNKQELCLLSIVIIMNFLFGMSGNVDNWAHFGGLLTGLFLGLCIPAPVTIKENEKYYRGLALIGGIGLFVLFIGLLWGKYPPAPNSYCP